MSDLTGPDVLGSGYDAAHRASKLTTHLTHAWPEDLSQVWSAPLARSYVQPCRKRRNPPFGERARSARGRRPC
jgi:hypothetical protein